MTENEWQRVWEVYRRAREMSSADCAAFLASVDVAPALFEQITLLLEERDSSGPGEPPSKMREQESWAGKTLGRYHILASLGKGGMGEVYAARDGLLDRRVALKFIGAALDGAALDGILREARAASALNYPNIVTVHEVVDLDEGAALVMELVEGSTLRELRDPAPPLADLLDWARQAAEALAGAHGHGIVHGDIKPDNIMVRVDGIVKLVDFGLARNSARQGAHDPFPAGTPRYMSPEQISGNPVNGASDVYSLGIVLSELCGQRTLPRALGILIQAMLGDRPADRPSSVEVAAALRRICHAQAYQHWQPVRWWWLGSNAGVLLLAALGFQLFHRPTDKPSSAPMAAPVVIPRRAQSPPSASTPAAASAWQISSKYSRTARSSQGAGQSPRP